MVVLPDADVNVRGLADWHRTMPWPVRIAFLALIATVVGLAVHGIIGLGGRGIHNLLDAWVSCGAEFLAAAVCAFGALRSERNRSAWLFVAAAIASWAIGDTIWSVQGDPETTTTLADVFWLAWYPLIVVALVLLVRDRVPKFELHRWIDGIVVMLVVVTPWVALFLAPAAQSSRASDVVDAIDFAYPLCDAVVVGAALGVIALMGWRAGPMWTALIVGFTALGIADAIYSVDVLGHTYSSDTVFDALWLGGITVIVYAAWLPRPARLDPVEVYGWRAIALPLAAQLFAVTLQLLGLFVDVPPTERVLTIVVLLIATVQIVVSRPRAPQPSGSEIDG